MLVKNVQTDSWQEVYDSETKSDYLELILGLDQRNDDNSVFDVMSFKYQWNKERIGES